MMISGNVPIRLVRGTPCRQEQDSVKFESKSELVSDNQMAVVYGIERASEYSQSLHGRARSFAVMADSGVRCFVDFADRLRNVRVEVSNSE
jgi:hypothetical protein